MTRAYLQFKTSRGLKQLPIGDEPVTFGRGQDNRFPLKDDEVSRYHCVIEKSPNGFVLRDLDSRNGVVVGKRRVHGEVALKDGDVFRVGKSTFRFVADSAAAAPVEDDRDDQLEDVPVASAPAPDELAKADPGAGSSGARADEIASLLRPGRREAAMDDASPPLDAFVTTEDRPRADGLPQSDDPFVVLTQLAHSRDNMRFTENDLSLINARGKVVHESNLDESNDDEKPGSAEDAIRLVRVLLMACAGTRATDLHVEPKQREASLRLRIDGTMIDAAKISQILNQRMQSLVKILSDIDITQRETIQEGHFSAAMPGREVDYRVSFTPSRYGQKLVLRVLDSANAPQHIADLGFSGWMQQEVRGLLGRDSGMLLICGPTGSGKTTTLYAGLRDIDLNKRNVITIEDPVEYQIEGVTQLPIDEYKGNTFNKLLRSVLRQDPDVILLGEIRDAETATTAMQAAMTGHLVMSTVHAKDAIGTIFRLLDLKVEPFLIASSLNLVLAQRLARQLCEHCRKSVTPTPTRLRDLLPHMSENPQRKIFEPVGCPKCFGTGYNGRIAVYELLTVDDNLRDVIMNQPTMQAIRRVVSRTLFSSLRQNGMKLVAEGRVAYDEILRVVGSE